MDFLTKVAIAVPVLICAAVIIGAGRRAAQRPCLEPDGYADTEPPLPFGRRMTPPTDAKVIPLDAWRKR